MIDRSRQGIALLAALAILVVVGGISALMFARTVTEVRHSGDDTGIVQSLLLARGAANLAGGVLTNTVRPLLDEIVENTSSTTERWSYGTGEGDEPTVNSVVPALSDVASALQDVIDVALCDQTIDDLTGGGEVAIRVFVTDETCGEVLPEDVRLPGGRFIRGAARTDADPANEQVYALPFVVVAEGRVGPYARHIVTSGEYQFTVGRGSFAQYALFTNIHRAPTGETPWFTERTLFDGPVHTNEHFRFHQNPWFGGEGSQVSSAGCLVAREDGTGCAQPQVGGAVFFDAGFQGSSGWSTEFAQAPVFGTSAPVFQGTGGVVWDTDYVVLPGSSYDQEEQAIISGLPFNGDLTLLELVAARPSVGDPDTMIPVPADEDASHQLIRTCRIGTVTETVTERVCGNVCTRYNRRGQCTRTEWRCSDVTRVVETAATVCDEYRYEEDGALERRTLLYDTDSGLPTGAAESASEWEPTGVEFNGVIHVDGEIERLRGAGRTAAGEPRPALASFAQITVAAAGRAGSSPAIRITGDLTYEDVPCDGTPQRSADGSVDPARCENLGARNVLGVYSQDGDLLIGNPSTWNDPDQLRAPDDITIHGVLMSSRGIVGVENNRDGVIRGTVNLLGGVIENYYGIFGWFSGTTPTSGYGRSFAFDQRMGQGLAPPYFPTVTTDGVRNIAVFAFGQREQVPRDPDR